MRRMLGFLSLAVILTGCSTEETNGDIARIQHSTAHRIDSVKFDDLLHPIAIEVSIRGDIYVADKGDNKIKVFGSDGSLLQEIGGAGSGPGEFRNLAQVVVVERSVLGFDPSGARITRFDEGGQFVDELKLPDLALWIDGAWDKGVVIANSPTWSVQDDASRVLFKVMNIDGSVRHIATIRDPQGNAFANQIYNFVFTAPAKRDLLWIAWLNDPKVALYSLEEGGIVRTFNRSVPFEWQKVEPQVTPSRALMSGESTVLPYDAISLTMDSDSSGTAYVLTSMQPTAEMSGDEAPESAVDRVEPQGGGIDRYRIPMRATDLAVSPDGTKIYLLDEETAEVRVFQLEGGLGGG